VVNVFSPVNVFTSANEVTTSAGTTRQILHVALLDHGATAFYRYFTRF
jgi:hypothetical protein